MTPARAYLTARQVQDACATHFGVSVDAILGARRGRDIVIPRQVAMLICRDLLPQRSYPEIGRAFNRDHSTVIAGVHSIEERISRDRNLALGVASLRSLLSDSARTTDIDMTAKIYAESVADAFRRSVLMLAGRDPVEFIRLASNLIPTAEDAQEDLPG